MDVQTRHQIKLALIALMLAVIASCMGPTL